MTKANINEILSTDNINVFEKLFYVTKLKQTPVFAKNLLTSILNSTLDEKEDYLFFVNITQHKKIDEALNDVLSFFKHSEIHPLQLFSLEYTRFFLMKIDDDLSELLANEVNIITINEMYIKKIESYNFLYKQLYNNNKDTKLYSYMFFAIYKTIKRIYMKFIEKKELNSTQIDTVSFLHEYYLSKNDDNNKILSDLRKKEHIEKWVLCLNKSIIKPNKKASANKKNDFLTI